MLSDEALQKVATELALARGLRTLSADELTRLRDGLEELAVSYHATKRWDRLPSPSVEARKVRAVCNAIDDLKKTADQIHPTTWMRAANERLPYLLRRDLLGYAAGREAVLGSLDVLSKQLKDMMDEEASRRERDSDFRQKRGYAPPEVTQFGDRFISLYEDLTQRDAAIGGRNEVSKTTGPFERCLKAALLALDDQALHENPRDGLTEGQLENAARTLIRAIRKRRKRAS
jgi:hypothetical protein